MEDFTKNLYHDLIKCKDICHQFNQILPSKEQEQVAILKRLLGKMGEDVSITSPFYCDLGYNIEIGDHFFANHNLTILDGAKVKIGNNVFIAPNCCLSTAEHPLDYEQRNAGIEYALPIEIEDNVWIGANVTILSQVKIGKNTVIGAGSVVTKDIPENVIAVGNPCKILRHITEADRFDPEKYKSLRFSQEEQA